MTPWTAELEFVCGPENQGKPYVVLYHIAPLRSVELQAATAASYFYVALFSSSRVKRERAGFVVDVGCACFLA